MITKLIKISTSWCGPCRQLKQELKDFNLVPIEEYDADENQSFCDEFNVKSVPTLIFLDGDKEVYRNVGFISKIALIQKIKELNENI